MAFKQYFPIFMLLLVASAAVLVGCRKEKFATGSDQMLTFSADTVFFDTVFVSVGSTTQYFKAYNPHQETIKVDQVYLEGGIESPFRINVDGLNGASQSDIEIAGEDSLFVLIEVTVDPSEADLPFVVEDFLVFESNGNTQKVLLTVWGQNAIFHGKPTDFITDLDCNETWIADLPHVVYGIVRVNPGCELTIGAGTQVYCHANSGLFVDGGVLTIDGDLGNEVCFQGDRLEPLFADEPGQWGIQVDFQLGEDFSNGVVTQSFGGILLSQCEGSTIDYAIIKNGIIGIQVDTLANPNAEALTLTNTKILNMSATGLLAQGSNISGNNNLIANCGLLCANFSIGGSYRFDHCTFANYWSFGTRQSPTFALSNWFESGNSLFVRPLYNTQFRNCIMYGNNADLEDYNEFVVNVIDEGTSPEYFFQECLVDTDQDLDDPLRFQGMENGATPSFSNTQFLDFTLNYAAEPPALGGLPFTTFSDLAGTPRPQGINPEMGCYEWVP